MNTRFNRCHQFIHYHIGKPSRQKFAQVNYSVMALAYTRATIVGAIHRPAKLIGFGCLAITALGWGLNWPATKLLLEQCPPLTARGIAGIVASLALAGIAASRGETLVVPRHFRCRLVGSALLNVSAWMGLTTLSLVWLNAGEAATLAYTTPVWTALLAWPVLGEKLVLRKIAALVLGICGIIVLLGGNGLSADRAKLPGVVIALAAAMLFALGTVLCKRLPLNMTSIAMTAWQVGIGCIVLLGASLVLEHPHLLEMHWFGWAALSYTAAVSLGICYITWFTALRRLEAGTAAIGTLLTPIIGVVASAISLGEPLLVPQFASLTLVATGIMLAVKPSRRVGPPARGE
jgi:drug/metabolite transporter (DMT)-like permease